ncbi:acyl-CoA ligase (AMP-forming), exosortase A system-associated [Microvirga sp. SRT01]|uniref:Acyl-CoA ligase (AMP-forming), exosortase A system-associated n=1 Tax=Sphingomonas longa TaxID=2778730 RepID=A0ABS2DBT3_9SPHN|nr:MULTISPECIES: acyl-CoA ligase (AMP-forming), exosortase A system-associated [Alphaproteobacteria]MBM6578404.1 acyl-CoA ligase (AMP-forming), exosortase A system-associated [Sphingomonas sp. BT552]MBR7711444.1 acyl-CoA ligase (AMP-forming), exosortase A system-associated [Microvirga sp. SRT01]
MIPLDPVAHPLDHLTKRGAPDAVALVDRAGDMTYTELEVAVGGMAAWLSPRHQPGERIATWLPKTRAACIMPLAVARAGLIHVPVNPALRRAQVAHILADSGAAMLLTQPTRATTLEPGDVPAGCTIVAEADVMRALPDHVGPSSLDPQTLAAILYTSGSTGRPKGVMLSHANLWLGAISVAHYLELETKDRVLGVLPLAFDYGQNQLFSTWAAGASVAPLDYLVARDVVKAVERTGATTLAGVPPLWVQLLDADWSSEAAARLRRLTNSGGALPPRLVGALRERFPKADLYPMYGLTEAFRSTYLPPALVDAHPEAMGRAIPYADVAIVRPDGTRAAPDEAGELVHAGPLVAQGYWQDPDRTAERFRPAPAFMAQGTAVWSGDTVKQGADGLFRFVGRDDEMIKSAGNRLSPQEIEEAVLSGGEAREAVAIGVPDERLGQAIVAAVAGDPASEEALRKRLKADLPAFMQPVRYVWHDELPRNANGKLDRAGIRRSMTS